MNFRKIALASAAVLSLVAQPVFAQGEVGAGVGAGAGAGVGAGTGALVGAGGIALGTGLLVVVVATDQANGTTGTKK